MGVNWSALQAPDIAGSFMSGLQHGQQRRKEVQQEEAFSAYAQNPDDPNAFTMMAKVNPRMAMGIREDQEKRKRETAATELARRAASGDNAALQEMMVSNPDAFKTIDGATKARMKEANDFLGNAAMQISRLPEEQRAATWSQYVQQAESGGMDIPSYLEAYSPQALNTAVARAGMVNELLNSQKVVWHQVGERPSFATDAYGQPVGSDNPYNAGTGGEVTPAGPTVGAIEDGYRFKGGDPSDSKSWEPVSNGGQTPHASGTFRPSGIAGERITSTFRSPSHNAKVGGVSNSYHTRKGADGRAMARDSVPPPGMSMADYAAKLRRQNPNYDVINEGDHVHIEPRG